MNKKDLQLVTKALNAVRTLEIAFYTLSAPQLEKQITKVAGWAEQALLTLTLEKRKPNA